MMGCLLSGQGGQLTVNLVFFAGRFLRDFSEDGDATVGADGGAEGTTGAIVFRIEQHDGAIAFAVEFGGQDQNVGRAGFAA
jgi:hypothetical protein